MTGGRIVGALVLGRVINHRTKRVVRYLVQELHSTKGWKPRTEVAESRFPWGPIPGEYCRRHFEFKIETSDAGRWMRNRELAPTKLNPKRALVHAWQRKEAASAEL